MNRAAIVENTKRLLDYATKRDQEQEPETSKLTIRLNRTYHDVMRRLAILEGTNRTEIVRRALDHYSEQWGDEVLFPRQ
jgi:hypothetical protein